VPVYDRSQLIKDSVKTLGVNLLPDLAVVVAVITLFLFHFRSALVSAITLPVATIASFTAILLPEPDDQRDVAGRHHLGPGGHGRLRGGARGKLAPTHRGRRARGAQTPRIEVVLSAMKELGSQMFGALLVLTVAFLPVFALEGEEGRLFRPLAMAKRSRWRLRHCFRLRSSRRSRFPS
jgi:Cu(I)/Ag(I) efflux system membrane protein CusA/SilA